MLSFVSRGRPRPRSVGACSYLSSTPSSRQPAVRGTAPPVFPDQERRSRRDSWNRPVRLPGKRVARREGPGAGKTFLGWQGVGWPRRQGRKQGPTKAIKHDAPTPPARIPLGPQTPSTAASRGQQLRLPVWAGEGHHLGPSSPDFMPPSPPALGAVTPSTLETALAELRSESHAWLRWEGPGVSI